LPAVVSLPPLAKIMSASAPPVRVSLALVPTVKWMGMELLSLPSLTSTVSVEVPLPVEVVAVIVRLAPVPLKEIMSSGTRAGLEEVAVRVRSLEALSASATLRLMVPLLLAHVPTASTATVGAVLGVGSSSSKEPMSHLAVPSSSPSWSLVTPRWSVAGSGQGGHRR